MRGQTATGAVVDFHAGRNYRNPTARRRDADPRNVYEYRAPMIRFTSENNEFAALLGSFPDGLNKGDTIAVVYSPEGPRGAELRAHHAKNRHRQI